MENGKKRNKWAHSAKPTFFKCSVFTSIWLEMAQKLHKTPNLHWQQCAKQFWPIAPSSKISKFWWNFLRSKFSYETAYFILWPPYQFSGWPDFWTRFKIQELEFAHILTCGLLPSDKKLDAWQLREVGWFSDLLHKVPTFPHFWPFCISTCLTNFAPVTTSFMPSEPNTYAWLANSMGLLTVGSDFQCDLWSGQTLFSKMD